jgi:translation initiation factor IF-2
MHRPRVVELCGRVSGVWHGLTPLLCARAMVTAAWSGPSPEAGPGGSVVGQGGWRRGRAGPAGRAAGVRQGVPHRHLPRAIPPDPPPSLAQRLPAPAPAPAPGARAAPVARGGRQGPARQSPPAPAVGPVRGGGGGGGGGPPAAGGLAQAARGGQGPGVGRCRGPGGVAGGAGLPASGSAVVRRQPGRAHGRRGRRCRRGRGGVVLTRSGRARLRAALCRGGAEGLATARGRACSARMLS